MRTEFTGPMRGASGNRMIPSVGISDMFSHRILGEYRERAKYPNMAMDGPTQRDLELFQSFSGKNVFSLIDRSSSPYGQARLWQLLENPMRDPGQINRRQDAVRELMTRNELRGFVQGALSALYEPEVILKTANGPGTFNHPTLRLSVIEQLIRGKYEYGQKFEYGKARWSAGVFYGLRKLLGGGYPLGMVTATTIAMMNRTTEAIATTPQKPPIETEMFAMGILLSVMVLGLEYVMEFRPGFSAAKSFQLGSLVEANRLFALARELSGQLQETQSEQLRKLGESFAKVHAESNPWRLTDFARRVEARVAMDQNASVRENWWFNYIPLGHELQKPEIVNGITNILFCLGELDALCSQAETALALKFNFASVGEGTTARFAANGLYHPFFEKPVANDVRLDAEHPFMMLSGPNGAGKSGILTAAPLAMILTQMGGGGPYRSLAMTPFDAIVTNINRFGFTSANLSTFYQEEARTREVLNLATGRQRVFLGLDQLYMGSTNHSDAVAASIVLSQLIAGGKDTRTIFATHIEELPLWVDQEKPAGIDNFHMRAEVVEGAIKYLFQIHDGRNRLRVALRVLEDAGFPAELLSQAKDLARELIPAIAAEEQTGG